MFVLWIGTNALRDEPTDTDLQNPKVIKLMKRRAQDKAANNVMSAHAEDMFKQYGLKVNGAGGAMLTNIKSLLLNFEGRGHYYNLEETGRVYVNCVEGFIAKINSDEDIREYLHQYPVSLKNIELRIRFTDPETYKLDSRFVSFVYLVNGKIFYEVDDPDSPDFKRLHQEPYEEALRIVREETL